MRILGGFGGPVFFEMFPLVGLVGIDCGLAHGSVAEHFVDGNAGGIEGHEDGGALHFVRDAAEVIAGEHVRHFADAVAHSRGENSCGAIDIVHGEEIAGRVVNWICVGSSFGECGGI